MSIDNLFNKGEPSTTALQEASNYELQTPTQPNTLPSEEYSPDFRSSSKLSPPFPKPTPKPYQDLKFQTSPHSLSKPTPKPYHRLMEKGKNAFTLIELLTVIGISSILMSILLPALSKARDSAYKTQCLANIRSVGQIATNYVIDNKGWINDNTLASRIEQTSPTTHPNVGPIFDYFVGGHSVPVSEMEGKAEVFYCPKDAQDMKNLSLGNHSLSNPVLVSFYKAGYSMATGVTGNKINVESKNYLSNGSKKATWMERTLNHKTGANTLYADGHGKFVKMDFDVDTDPINAFLTANQN